MSAPLLAVDEVKAFLRVETDEEDAVLSGLVRVATELAEQFTGVKLLLDEVRERVPGQNTSWARLRQLPVSAIGSVGGLPGSAFATLVDADGEGWVRLLARQPGPVEVRYTAGLGPGWNDVPEAIRQGVVRLVAHLWTHRDAVDTPGLPAAVAALWRPWRRLRLG